MIKLCFHKYKKVFKAHSCPRRHMPARQQYQYFTFTHLADWFGGTTAPPAAFWAAGPFFDFLLGDGALAEEGRVFLFLSSPAFTLGESSMRGSFSSWSLATDEDLDEELDDSLSSLLEPSFWPNRKKSSSEESSITSSTYLASVFTAEEGTEMVK